MKSFILSGIIVSVFFNFSFAQNLLTPEDVVKIALKNNFAISIARNNQEIADNNVSAGNAGMLPSLDASAAYSKSINNTNQEYFDGRTIDRNGAKSNNISAGVELNWTIFDGLKMFAALDRLKQIRKSGELNFKLTVEQNLSDIFSTYYGIVRQKQVLTVINKNLAISQERVDIAKSKLDVGSGSKFELLQAQVDLNEDKSSLLNEEQTLADAKITLNNLMGRDVNTDFTVMDTIIVNKDIQFEDIKSIAINKNSELQLAKINQNIAGTNLRLANGEWFPKISLSAGYNYLKSESEAGFIKSNQNTGLTYGVTASLNIFDGLNTQNQIQNAQIDIENSKLTFKQIENKINAEILNVYQNYKNSIELITLEKENLKVAEENVSIALEKLHLGDITPVEFRETQRKMFDAKSRFVSAEYSAKVAEINLLRLSGQLIK